MNEIVRFEKNTIRLYKINNFLMLYIYVKSSVSL